MKKFKAIEDSKKIWLTKSSDFIRLTHVYKDDDLYIWFEKDKHTELLKVLPIYDKTVIIDQNLKEQHLITCLDSDIETLKKLFPFNLLKKIIINHYSNSITFNKVQLIVNNRLEGKQFPRNDFPAPMTFINEWKLDNLIVNSTIIIDELPDNIITNLRNRVLLESK